MPREVGDDIERNMDDLDYEFEDGATFDLEEFVAMGINPSSPTTARPGSEEKVLMLSARYAAGMPLWHEEDCYDHGPNDLQFKEYLWQTDRESDVRMNFVKKLLEYFYLHRESLKDKSNLHRLLLDKEE